MKIKQFVAVAVAVVGLIALPLTAYAGGKHGSAASDPPCTVSGSVVQASGLPTGEVINFMVTDSSGTNGWVLGTTDTGDLSATVPAANGATTYQFVSRTWGPDGSHYNVYSSCSA